MGGWKVGLWGLRLKAVGAADCGVVCRQRWRMSFIQCVYVGRLGDNIKTRISRMSRM